MSPLAGVFSEAATPVVLEPEPPNGSFELVGDFPVQVLYQRDDDEAERGDWGDWRWFVVADPEVDPVPWSKLASRPHQRMYLREDLPRSAVESLDAIERAGASS